MVTTYGSFPGVRVEVAGGGITAVSIGEEEKLVIFGEADYQTDDPVFDTKSDGDADALEAAASPNEPVTINARREADTYFGAGTELADAMREALANGANIEFLYGVAPSRYNAIGETQTTAGGTLNNPPIWEDDVSDDSNIETITVDDTGGVSDIPVQFTYESPPAAPTDETSDVDTVVVNPLTGEYEADQAPSGDLAFNYKYLDWQGALEAGPVTRVVDENETGVYDLLTDADSVSSTANGVAATRRDDFQLVTAFSGAQPNDNSLVEDENGNYVTRYARVNPDTYTQGSVDSDYYFKLAPVRLSETTRTILGAAGGLFAGNPLDDPIYNDPISVSGDLAQQYTPSDEQSLRDANVIPVRQTGSVRVKDNTSTSTETDWDRDFWRRRIADRVILIGKTVGDTILGQVNRENTRNAAERLIESELRELVSDGILKPNTTDENNWFVDVYESSTDPDQVNIDIGFTPYGLVKRIDETITINT